MDDSDRSTRIIAIAAEALAAEKAGQEEVAVDLVTGYLSGTPEGVNDIGDLVLFVFSECGKMVTALSEAEQIAPVTMQVLDQDGSAVSIDDADPPVRTAIRTLLADVHGDQHAAAEQIAIALDSGRPQELATVVLQALRWTLNLAVECRARDVHVSSWIAAALDNG